MAHEKIRAALLFITIITIVGSISWVIVNDTLTQTKAQEPKPMPDSDIKQYVRDTTVAYIKANHLGAVQFLNNLSWTRGRSDTNLVGVETQALQDAHKNQPLFAQ